VAHLRDSKEGYTDYGFLVYETSSRCKRETGNASSQNVIFSESC